MTATLVALTRPMDGSTPEQFIVKSARVSNPASAEAGGGEARLLAYLIRNAHWSPLEMVSATIEIRTTRDISRQIIRHRSFSFQEFSGRYAEMPDEPVWREARLQDHQNRQNSIATDDNDTHRQFATTQRDVWETANRAYRGALKRGIAKEQARALLPEGLTPTTIAMAGTLRSWLHYINLRDGNGTQAEHAVIARACRDALAPYFPLILGAAL